MHIFIDRKYRTQWRAPKTETGIKRIKEEEGAVEKFREPDMGREEKRNERKG